MEGNGAFQPGPTVPHVIIIIIYGNRVCFKHFRGVFACCRLTMYNYAKASIEWYKQGGGKLQYGGTKNRKTGVFA